MTDHITTSRMQRFSVRALPPSELTSIAKHLDVCPSCHEQFTEMLRSRRGSRPLKITLAPEFQLRNEHVDYDQLVRLADSRMDATEREMLDVHLKVCASCQEDVRSFLALREEIDNETETAPTAFVEEPTREKRPWFAWWQGLAWNPAYAAAVVLIGIALVIGVALFLKRRAANLEARQTPPPQGLIGPAKQTPTPENQAVAVQPTPVPVPSEQLPRHAQSPPLTVKDREPIRKPENATALVALSDGQRTISVNSAGGVSGLEDMPVETQRDVAETLAAQKMEQPEIAKELSPTNITLRGSSAGQPFKLLSPGRTVIVDDRPSFEWERLPGATAYRILVGDMRGHEVAKSEDLPPDRTSWTPPKSLKRGETYAWNVIAIVDGKEIVSPGASASEMKFKVLSDSSAEELRQLKKANSHLALGVFYAREGMITEAEREFEFLAKQNPNSPLANKLLRQIQSWQKR
jgi:hypothetical protein